MMMNYVDKAGATDGFFEEGNKGQRGGVLFPLAGEGLSNLIKIKTSF
jgi:hypothetical protein